MIQDVLLHHLEVAVLGRDVTVLQGDEDGLAVLPVEPILRLDGAVGSRRVGVKVVLEEVRLSGDNGEEEIIKGANLIHFTLETILSLHHVHVIGLWEKRNPTQT